MWADCFRFLGLETQGKHHLLALSRQIYVPLKHYIFIEVIGEQCLRLQQYLVLQDRLLMSDCFYETMEFGFYENQQFVSWVTAPRYDTLETAQRHSKGPFIGIPINVRTVARLDHDDGPLTPLTLFC